MQPVAEIYHSILVLGIPRLIEALLPSDLLPGNFLPADVDRRARQRLQVLLFLGDGESL